MSFRIITENCRVILGELRMADPIDAAITMPTCDGMPSAGGK
jgi:hypothetical protein